MFDRRLLTVLLLAAFAWTVVADAAQARCAGRCFGRFRGVCQAAPAGAWPAQAVAMPASGCPGGACSVR